MAPTKQDESCERWRKCDVENVRSVVPHISTCVTNDGENAPILILRGFSVCTLSVMQMC